MISFPSCLNRLLPSILFGCLLFGTAEAATLPPAADLAARGTSVRIAVFPVENLSGTPVPLREITAELHEVLGRAGVLTVEPAAIERFIEGHRLRYLGGIDETTAALLRAETGADAVLISTIELYSEVSPPKFSMISRMVSLKEVPEIVWMESVGIAGDDAPGILGLGLIEDLTLLRGKGVGLIGASLKRHLSAPPVRRERVSARERREEEPFTLKTLVKGITTEKRLLTDPSYSRTGSPDKGEQPDKTVTAADTALKLKPPAGLFKSRFNPLGWYSSRDPLVAQERSIAIIPFFNRSTRKHAAELQVLHLAAQLVTDGNFRVLEFGVIRDKLLSMHVVMSDGISIPGLDLVGISLGVDLLLNGVVFDYLDTVGYGSSPRVDFSMQMFDRDNKKILWSSHSHNQGDDKVYFFDYGRVATAGALADNMCRALVLKLVENAGE